MEITFLGATHEVTGSCTMITVNGHHFLIDCGMEQGKDIFENQEIPVNPGEIECIVLTHAHIDHSGKIPLIYKNGFRGKIYATEATCNLCDIMLRDSAHIQEFEAEWKNRKGLRAGSTPVEPMYTVEDAENAIRQFIPHSYNERFQILDGAEIRFNDIGHLLGSAAVEIWLNENGVEKKIVFSGDIGNKNKPILNDPEKIEEADYVVIESTYGDRYHEKAPGDETFEAQLAGYIQKTLDRGGNVVIPVFAVGRTQEILYFIHKIKNKGLVHGHDGFKVFIDSPLANEATGIFMQTDREYFDEDLKAMLNAGENPLSFPGLEMSVSSDESRAINMDMEPKVILSASGMCEAGRIRHHLKHNLWRKESLILFAGYQAEGTLGRSLFEGAKTVKLFGEEIQVNAEIGLIAGISGHADKAGLLDWIDGFKKKPELVFVNHGEDQSASSFTECLCQEKGYHAVAPYSGTIYSLTDGVCLHETEGIPVEKKTYPAGKAASFYAALVAAGKRLMNLISHFEGRPNKDVKRLTREIDDLVGRWEDE